MSQHDMIVDNGSGLGVRTDINAALQALASTSIGPVEPPVTYAGQLWLDTTVLPNGRLRQRNPANSAWVAIDTGAVIIDGTGNITIPGATIAAPANALTVATGLTRIVFRSLDTSQTWTKQSGLKFVDAIAIGGGGGSPNLGNSAAGQSVAGGGGGGGGMARKFYLAADLPATVAVVIGPAGAIGGNAGATTFAGLTANGGTAGSGTTGGATPSVAPPGTGGTATGGDVNIAGGNGEYGLRSAHGSPALGYCGGGGASFMAPYTPGFVNGGTVNGLAGIVPGGGARGTTSNNASGAATGAIGGIGRTYLMEYY